PVRVGRAIIFLLPPRSGPALRRVPERSSSEVAAKGTPMSTLTAFDTRATRPMTLTQKILAHHAANLSRPWIQAGDMLQLGVDWTIASELAWNGMDRTYTLLGRPKLANPSRFYLALDHTVDPVTLARDARTQKLATLSRTFARESGIQHFYDANETIM